MGDGRGYSHCQLMNTVAIVCQVHCSRLDIARGDAGQRRNRSRIRVTRELGRFRQAGEDSECECDDSHCLG